LCELLPSDDVERDWKSALRSADGTSCNDHTIQHSNRFQNRRSLNAACIARCYRCENDLISSQHYRAQRRFCEQLFEHLTKGCEFVFDANGARQVEQLCGIRKANAGCRRDSIECFTQ
jgi:hypothetical protein